LHVRWCPLGSHNLPPSRTDPLGLRTAQRPTCISGSAAKLATSIQETELP
jgi:hypothetical protein